MSELPLRRRPSDRNVVLVSSISVALVALGAFLPWVKATAGIFTLSRSGLEHGGDGLFTLILAIAVAVAIWLGYTAQIKASQLHAALVVAGVIVAGVAIYDMGEVDDRRDLLSSEQREIVDVSVGEGLYLTLLGGIGLAGAGALGIFGRKPMIDD